MPATEVDLRDYRPFTLSKLPFLRRIPPLESVLSRFLVARQREIRQTSVPGMISGVAR